MRSQFSDEPLISFMSVIFIYLTVFIGHIISKIFLIAIQCCLKRILFVCLFFKKRRRTGKSGTKVLVSIQ